MSSSISEVGIKIIIDAKEGRQQLQLSESDLIRLIKQSDILKDKYKESFTEVGTAAKQLKAEILGVANSQEDLSEAVADYIKYSRLTEQEIQQVISSLKTEQSAFAVGSAQYNEHGRAISSLQNGYKHLLDTQQLYPQNAQKISTTTGMMNQALTQFAWVLSDSDMYMVNLQMGLRSTANNFPMVIQSFMQARDAAKVAGTSIKQELVASLMGTGGLMLAITGVTLLIQVLVPLFDSTTEAIRKTGDEADKTAEKLDTLGAKIARYKFSSIEEARKSLKEYNKEAQTGIDEIQKKLDEAKKKQRDASTRTVDDYQTGGVIQIDNRDSEAYKEASRSVREYEAELKKLIDEKELYNQYITKTTDKLVKFKAAMTQNSLSQEEFNNLLKDFNNNEKRALLSEIEDLKGVFYDGEVKNITSANLERLRKAIKDDEDKFRVDNPSYDALGQEAAKAKELKGELEKLIVLKKTYLTNNQKSIELKQIEYDSRIQAYKDEIEILKGKPNKTQDDYAKISNLNTSIKLAEEQKVYELEELKKKNLSETIELKIRHFELDSQLSALHGQTSFYMRDMLIKDLESLLPLVKTQEDRLKIEQELFRLRQGIFQEMREVNLPAGSQGGKSPSEIAEEEQQVTQALWDEKQKRYDILQEMVHNVADAYNSIYQILQNSARKEISEWQRTENKKLDAEHKNALRHARTQKQREKIDAEYEDRKQQIQEEADAKARDRLQSWFEMQKAVSIAQATIATYEAADKQLSMNPVGPWNYALAAAIIAAGLANVALISQQEFPGYEKGGIVIGEKGPEIIAPMQDYAQGWSRLVGITSAMTVLAVKQNLENIVLKSPSVNMPDNAAVLRELKLFNKNLDAYSKRPQQISSRISKVLYYSADKYDRKSTL